MLLKGKTAMEGLLGSDKEPCFSDFRSGEAVLKDLLLPLRRASIAERHLLKPTP
jgi:hypothetical protein